MQNSFLNHIWDPAHVLLSIACAQHVEREYGNHTPSGITCEWFTRYSARVWLWNMNPKYWPAQGHHSKPSNEGHPQKTGLWSTFIWQSLWLLGVTGGHFSKVSSTDGRPRSDLYLSKKNTGTCSLQKTCQEWRAQPRPNSEHRDSVVSSDYDQFEITAMTWDRDQYVKLVSWGFCRINVTIYGSCTLVVIKTLVLIHSYLPF